MPSDDDDVEVGTDLERGWMEDEFTITIRAPRFAWMSLYMSLEEGKRSQHAKGQLLPGRAGETLDSIGRLAGYVIEQIEGDVVPTSLEDVPEEMAGGIQVGMPGSVIDIDIQEVDDGE